MRRVVWSIGWLAAAVLVVSLALLSPGPKQEAQAQPAPPSQCVSTAVAGGTSDALTVPRLPCGPTTTLLVLTTGPNANTTTAPTLQQAGSPAYVVLNFDGAALGIGALSANSKMLLTFNGTNWFLLNGNVTEGNNPLITGGLELCNGFASCNGSVTTAIGSAGSSQVTLASANGWTSSCQAGSLVCGIMIGGAGAPFAIGKPAGPGVASFCATQTLQGSTTAGSPVVFMDPGMQGVSNGATISDGGVDIPNGTTVADYNETIRVIRMSANATGSGAHITITVADPCNVTYAYKIASYDSNGGVGAPTSAVTTTVGPHSLDTWNKNCITWSAPVDGSQPAGYVIWKSTDGGATYSFFQTSAVEGSGSCTFQNGGGIYDGGQSAQARPWWIPNDPNVIPVNGQPDWLATTIAAGGGTTTVTLATPLISAVPQGSDTAIGKVLHDDTDGYLAWIAALNAAGGAQGHINGPSVVRIRTGGTITTSGVKIVAQRGSSIWPVGPIGHVLEFSGAVPTTSFVPTNNFQEGSNCLQATGLGGEGAWVLVQQNAPGGISQSLPYTYVGTIAHDTCSEGGVQMADAAGVTFTDTTRTANGTVSGTVAATDTVTITVAGDVACSATYTVLPSDVAGGTAYVAMGMALAWSSQCPGVATSTGSVIQIQQPNYYQTLNYSTGATHGGGGSESIAMSAGTGFSVQLLPNVLPNVGADGLTFIGNDGVGNRHLAQTAMVGITVSYTIGSTFENLEFVDMNGGAGFLTFYNYGNQYRNIYLARASNGMPNSGSFSDFTSIGDSKAHIDHIISTDPQSFGPQIASGHRVMVSNVHTSNEQYGRGFKVAATVASQFNNISATDAVFFDIIVCCGSYRNTFVNLRADNGRGQNQDGIDLDNGWNRFNAFIGVKATGSRYDIVAQRSDIGNTWDQLDLGYGSGFGSVFIENSNIFRGINGCEVAVNQFPDTTNQLTCQIGFGTWTPTLAGATTAGSTTYSLQVGHWQQNYHYMTLTWALATNSALTGMTGDMQVLGMPSSPAAGGDNGACSFGQWGGVTLDANYTQLAGLMISGPAMEFIEMGSAQTAQILPTTSFTNIVQVYGTCVYRVW